MIAYIHIGLKGLPVKYLLNIFTSDLDDKVTNDDEDEAEQWQQNIEFVDCDEQAETQQHDYSCGMYSFDLPSCHSIVNEVSRMNNSSPNLQ